MPRHVAFLRAINVGGHTVTMNRLRGLFEELGFADVETFIASGNVAFTARAASGPALEKRIASHLGGTLGYDVATFVRTPAEVSAVAAYRAFRDRRPGATLYIGFTGRAPAPAASQSLRELATDIDSLALHGRELYWRCDRTFSLSKITGARLEKALGQPLTLRKSSTVEKLAAKLSRS